MNIRQIQEIVDSELENIMVLAALSSSTRDLIKYSRDALRSIRKDFARKPNKEFPGVVYLDAVTNKSTDRTAGKSFYNRRGIDVWKVAIHKDAEMDYEGFKAKKSDREYMLVRLAIPYRAGYRKDNIGKEKMLKKLEKATKSKRLDAKPLFDSPHIGGNKNKGDVLYWFYNQDDGWKSESYDRYLIFSIRVYLSNEDK